MWSVVYGLDMAGMAGHQGMDTENISLAGSSCYYGSQINV